MTFITFPAFLPPINICQIKQQRSPMKVRVLFFLQSTFSFLSSNSSFCSSSCSSSNSCSHIILPLFAILQPNKTCVCVLPPQNISALNQLGKHVANSQTSYLSFLLLGKIWANFCTTQKSVNRDQMSCGAMTNSSTRRYSVLLFGLKVVTFSNFST